MTSLLPKSVNIVDDTMREGLQIESAEIPLEDKLRLLDAIGEMGAKTISVGSFAHPKWTPSMASIDELVARFEPKPGIVYTAAVFNKRGFDRADAWYPKIDVRGRRFATHVELCDSFARRNYNRTQGEMIAAMDTAVQSALEAGATSGAVALGNPFGSNFEGAFTVQQCLELLDLMVGKWRSVGIPVGKVSLLDAMGWNMPHTTRELITAIRERYPEIQTYHMHLHNTRGVTIASYYEALLLGATDFDTSLGGMGGCPYCGNGRAAGHVPTEDFVNLCHEMGIETGYKLDKVIEAAVVAEQVVGHALKGHVSKAGPLPRDAACYPIDMAFVETMAEAAHFRTGPQAYSGQISPWRDGDALTRESRA
ncbi:MAG: citramalate synthase [Pseudomonadota bacterium]